MGKASIGGAVAINTIGAASNKQDVKAQINNADITTFSINSDVADINVKANNNADLLTLALGGAVVASSGTSISAEGSAAKSNIYTSTDASMTGTTIDNDDSSMAVAKIPTFKLFTRPLMNFPVPVKILAYQRREKP